MIDKEAEKIKQRKSMEFAEKSKWPDAPVPVTDESLFATIKKYSLVIIDCWAPWCGPCKMLSPIIDSLAREYKGKVVFAKLNTDDNLETARKFGITAIPTLLISKNGEIIDRIVGVMPKKEIEERIKKWTSKSS